MHPFMVVKWWELSYMKHTKHLCFAIHSLIHLFIHSLSRSGTRGVLPFNDIQYLGIVSNSFILFHSFTHSLSRSWISGVLHCERNPAFRYYYSFIHSYTYSFIPSFINLFIHFLGVGWGGVLVYETYPAFSRRYGGQNPGRLCTVYTRIIYTNQW